MTTRTDLAKDLVDYYPVTVLHTASRPEDVVPTIRVDDEVYAWLQSLARPFEDSPNTVLRRIGHLDPTTAGQEHKTMAITAATQKRSTTAKPGERLSGKLLNERWKVGAIHALYHQDGTFYENLVRFPGALFDPYGYVLFGTEREYELSPHLNIGQKLNVPGGISTLASYVRMR